MSLALLVSGCAVDRMMAERMSDMFGDSLSVTPPLDAPAFQEATAAPDHALLYVYRPRAAFNGGGSPDVHVGGGKKFSLRTQGYRPFKLMPGDYEIKAECNINWWPPSAARRLSVLAGQEYYVRITPTLSQDPNAEAALDPDAKGLALKPIRGICNQGRTLITLVPKAQALAEISQTRLIVD
jgi:hypothetical protein